MSLLKFGSKLRITASGLSLEEVVTETSPSTNYKTIETKSNEFLYFRSRAISAFETSGPNGNGDAFPRKELETSYETFNGRNLFLNHESDHPIKSIGKILDAYEVEDPETGEYYIECLSKIDRKLHPEIARKVETGELNTVSMGCSCEASKCSICGKSIFTDEDVKCNHLEPSGILKKYIAEVDLPEYGIKKGIETPAFSINSGLIFNELSIVNVPADADAFIKTIIASNIKTKITRKANLDETEIKHLQALLNGLDESTKSVIKENFCACELPKEESQMSDKELHKEVKDSKSAGKITEILSKLNGLEYIEFANWMEHKMDKESKKVVDTKKQLKNTDNKISSAIKKVKATFIGKLFNKAVKEELGGKQKQELHSKIIPIVLTAKFTEAKNFEDSYWTVFRGEKQVLQAYVKTLWDKEQLTQKKYRVWTASEDYGKKLIATYKKLGFLKTAKLLGLGFKTMEVTDSKVKTPGKKDFIKPEEKSKADKDYKKSEKAVEKADHEEPVGEEIMEEEDKVVGNKEKKDPNKKKAGHKPNCDCNFCKNIKKDKSDDKKDSNKKPDADKDGVPDWADKKPGQDDKEVEKKADEMESVDEMTPVVDEPTEDLSEESPEEDTNLNEEPVDAEPRSAFDKLDDKLIISDDLEAHKDKETNEIVIVDNTGTEVKRLEDGFGDDVPSVLKLLQDIMGIEQKPEDAQQDADNIEEPKTEESLPKIPVEEVEEVPLDASKKIKLSKEAEAEAKKHFANALKARIEHCQKIAEIMVDREMIQFKEKDVDIELKKGAALLDARELALKKSIDHQVKTLLGMDDLALEAFKSSVENISIKKEASNTGKLTFPINLGYRPSDKDSAIESIFDSMGNGEK